MSTTGCNHQIDKIGFTSFQSYVTKIYSTLYTSPSEQTYIYTYIRSLLLNSIHLVVTTFSLTRFLPIMNCGNTSTFIHLFPNIVRNNKCSSTSKNFLEMSD